MNQAYFAFEQRFFDVAASLMLLVSAAPVLALVALAVEESDPVPAVATRRLTTGGFAR